jgi:hypothetical protein
VRFAFVRFAIILIILLYLVPIRAQVINTIAYEQTVTGTITRETFRQVYSFTGKAGDLIDITMKVTGGTLDPLLILTDDQNMLLARDDDAGEGYSAVISNFQLPRDGGYFISAARFGQERGLTIGTFSLTLSRVGVSGGVANTFLRYGDNVVGEITPEAPEAVYGFTAKRGDLIKITLQRISGDLDPALILADSAGNIVTVNDEDTSTVGTLDASITDFLIRKTDNYLIVATRFGREAGTTRGGFSLTLDRTPPELLGLTLDMPAFIDYGETLTGTINADTVIRTWRFEAKRGDVITVEAERTRGTLDPTLQLYDPDQKPLVDNDAGRRGQLARITAYTIPRDGFYVIAVSRYDGEKGFSTGDFRLLVIGRQGVTVGANGVLILNYGGAVTSTIDGSSFDQQYVFEGQAGDLVTIIMQPTSDTLLPYVILFDQNRRLLAQSDPNQPLAAQIQSYKLPAKGVYIIVASRHGRAGGQSRGSYLLTLARERNS